MSEKGGMEGRFVVIYINAVVIYMQLLIVIGKKAGGVP